MHTADIEVQADRYEEEQELEAELEWYEWRKENAVWPIDPVDLCGFCYNEIEDDRKRGYVTLCRKCNHQYHMDEYAAGLL